ncbi:MAG: VanZ family protein [Bacillaceae bacterium]|nr:VanZ family protein [Bacillaceae bacterium]
MIKKFNYSISKITILGMFVSSFIETYQFLFTFRVANIDDVILNTFGTFIGATVFVLYLKLKKDCILFSFLNGTVFKILDQLRMRHLSLVLFSYLIISIVI